MTQPPSLLEVALQYIAAGLNVTPVLSPRSGKEGAGKAAYVLACQQRRLTPDEFTNEFRKGSNIGVVTGSASGLVCLDLDGREGLAWYYEHEGKLGHHLVERRGTSGIHLYFQYPPGLDGEVPSKLRLFPGVDLLADGGKQVVTWPSIHRSGEAYLFDNGLTLLDLEAEADPLPKWLMSELLHAAKKPEPSNVPTAGQDLPMEVDRCREQLSTYPAAVSKSGGNNTTFKAAALCRDFNLSPQKAVELLAEVYNPKCQPPWTAKELREIVRHAYQYAKKPAGNRTAAADFPDDPVLPDQADSPAEDVEPRYVAKYPVVSAQTYLKRNPAHTLCAKDQLYRYDPAAGCWRLIADNQFQSVVMTDIERSDPVTHKALRMTQVSETVKAVKRLLEGNDPDRDLQSDTWLDGRPGEHLACRNGILNIQSGELVPHDPKWFSFTVLPFDYDRDAEAPVFERFLKEIWDDDQELIETLRLWFGYMLIRDMREQKFAVFKGLSRGGKGTLVNVIHSLVGDNNISACSINTFGNDFGLQPLLDKRLGIFGDAERAAPDRLYTATERIKSITGNDAVSVNRKQDSILTVRLPVKIILVCNSIPPFGNDEGALTNRMLVFPFYKTFSGREDIHLGEKLNAELPGILNWALRGSRALMAGGRLRQSAAGATALEDIHATLDSVRGFVQSVVQFTGEQNHRINNATLWSRYNSWCSENNRAKKSSHRFFTDLHSAFRGRATPYRGADRGYLGIQLRSEDAAFEAMLPRGVAPVEDDSDIPF